MSAGKRWPNWIEEDNLGQVEWIVRYLLARVPLQVPLSGTPLEVLHAFKNQWHHLPIGEAQVSELEIKMHNAWYTHRSRMRKKAAGKKPHSYEISTPAARALKHLSKTFAIPQYQVLEGLILEVDAFRKDLEKKKKAEVEKIRPPGERRDRLAEKQRNQLDATNRMFEEWMIKVEMMLAVGAQQQIALRHAGMLNKHGEPSLTPEQQCEADTLQERWLAVLTRDVMRKTRLSRLHLREQRDS